MEVDRAQYGITAKQKSRAMTVLAWGNQLILSSTQKGGDSFSYQYKGTPVLEDLHLCQQVWKDATGDDQQHRARAMCAEPMACQLYYSLDAVAHLAEQHARVATVVENGQGVVEQQDPCPPPSQQVCVFFPLFGQESMVLTCVLGEHLGLQHIRLIAGPDRAGQIHPATEL